MMSRCKKNPCMGRHIITRVCTKKGGAVVPSPPEIDLSVGPRGSTRELT